MLLCTIATPAAADDAYVATIESERRARAVAYEDPATSPLRDAAPEAFNGLNFFVVDPAARRDATFVGDATPDSYRLPTFDGRFLDFVRIGRLEFVTRDGQSASLVLFQRIDEGERVAGYGLVPFRDATNGHETYPGGRYLEFELPLDGEPVLDFNRAVNPLCAYNPEFACPIPPAENRLAYRVEAGEKRYRPAAD